jgi:hypothetical protein
MSEEMRGEAMDAVVTAVEKYADDMEVSVPPPQSCGGGWRRLGEEGRDVASGPKVLDGVF